MFGDFILVFVAPSRDVVLDESSKVLDAKEDTRETWFVIVAVFVFKVFVELCDESGVGGTRELALFVEDGKDSRRTTLFDEIETLLIVDEFDDGPIDLFFLIDSLFVAFSMAFTCKIPFASISNVTST